MPMGSPFQKLPRPTAANMPGLVPGAGEMIAFEYGQKIEAGATGAEVVTSGAT